MTVKEKKKDKKKSKNRLFRVKRGRHVLLDGHKNTNVKIGETFWDDKKNWAKLEPERYEEVPESQENPPSGNTDDDQETKLDKDPEQQQFEAEGDAELKSMSVEELETYAEESEIDISHCKTKKQLIQTITAALDA